MLRNSVTVQTVKINSKCRKLNSKSNEQKKRKQVKKKEQTKVITRITNMYKGENVKKQNVANVNKNKNMFERQNNVNNVEKVIKR